MIYTIYMFVYALSRTRHISASLQLRPLAQCLVAEFSSSHGRRSITAENTPHVCFTSCNVSNRFLTAGERRSSSGLRLPGRSGSHVSVIAVSCLWMCRKIHQGSVQMDQMVPLIYYLFIYLFHKDGVVSLKSPAEVMCIKSNLLHVLNKMWLVQWRCRDEQVGNKRGGEILYLLKD